MRLPENTCFFYTAVRRRCLHRCSTVCLLLRRYIHVCIWPDATLRRYSRSLARTPNIYATRSDHSGGRKRDVPLYLARQHYYPIRGSFVFGDNSITSSVFSCFITAQVCFFFLFFFFSSFSSREGITIKRTSSFNSNSYRSKTNQLFPSFFLSFSLCRRVDRLKNVRVYTYVCVCTSRK